MFVTATFFFAYLSREVVHLANCGSVGRQDARNGRWEPGIEAEIGEARDEAARSGGGLDVVTVRAARAPQSQAAGAAVVRAAAKGRLPKVHLVVRAANSGHGGHLA